MDDNNLKLGEEYLLKVGTKMIPAIITDIKYKIDANTGEYLKTTILKKNEIALCDILLSEKVVVDKFSSNKTLGELILIDRVTNMTSACGVIENIDYNDSKKDVTFKFENLNARGDVFEEYYYNTQSLSIYKNKKNKKVYTVGDEIDIKGETFGYPKNFDILILRDWIAIEIRDKVITNIKSIDEYNFNNLPVVNGRGFKLNICDEKSLKSLLIEYKQINMNNINEFWNKWANINTYRNVIFS